MLSADPSNVRRRERYATEPAYKQSVKKRNNDPNRAVMRRTAKNKFRAIHPTSRLLESAKSRAKARGLPFEITEADIVIPDVCPIDGLPLERSNPKGPNPRSPSLDCVVPELGYVRGNIAVISFHWNRLKCTMTAADLRRLLAYIESHTV
jgi:hypothetical protein